MASEMASATKMVTHAVTILGPNMGRPLCDKGDLHVHRTGCADIKRQYGGVARYNEEHADKRSVVDSMYGPEAGSFYEEAGCENESTAWQQYEGEFWFAPCVSYLPDDVGRDED